MDYFQNQDVARKRTGLLVFLFITAVVLIILSVYLAIGVVLEFAEPEATSGTLRGPSRLWNPELFGMVALGTSGLIAGGSLFKIAALSGGGHTVADLLGGRLLHPDKASADERRLLNVVEEMAIASGLPVPPVYLLENESGINAFAAGHTAGDAVVAVTSGTLHRLTRDELQGVIAHEFSHILNGDMRLNIRLMGVLFGILVIGLTGWIIFRSSTGGGYVRLGARDDERKGFNPLPLIGLALYVIGYVGVFFGNLIKAAVSRQREFLADASAVQFTRNPDGIAGALKKIGALAEGSRVGDSHAEEASHMFFGEAVSGLNELFGLLSTHPPLVERIRRIDPSFTGDFSQVRLDRIEEASPRRERSIPGMRSGVMGLTAAAAVARVGTIDQAHIDYASDLKKSIPGLLAQAVRDPLGAQATVFALLLDPGDPVRQTQLAWLDAYALPVAVRETRKLMADARLLAPQARLPLVELAAPALCQMTPAQFHEFIRCVQALVQADNKLTLFEFALQRLLIRHVVTHFVGARPPSVKYTTPAPLATPVAVVLAALAYAGEQTPECAARAFAAGVQALGWAGARLELTPPGSVGIAEIDRSLEVLALAAPSLKKQIALACAACICVDGTVTIDEGELLRAVCDCLGCPMPPFIASGFVAPGEALAAASAP
jgi:Zn-dependent protease with chaperone function